MIVAFFESIKYVGHLFPLAVLRFYFGYFFLERSLERFNGDFLNQPILAARINEWLPRAEAPLWYVRFMDDVVVPNWEIFAYILTYCEFLLGISFLIGFLVRPASLVGLLVLVNLTAVSAPDIAELHRMTFAVVLVLFWAGAGRCLGFDYFFFKRKRGIWW